LGERVKELKLTYDHIAAIHVHAQDRGEKVINGYKKSRKKRKK